MKPEGVPAHRARVLTDGPGAAYFNRGLFLVLPDYLPAQAYRRISGQVIFRPGWRRGPRSSGSRH